MRKLFRLVLLLIFCLSLGFAGLSKEVLAQDVASPQSKIIITEIKLGDGADVDFGNGVKAKDFVTLYNKSAEPVLLDGWKLEYIKYDSSFVSCAAPVTSANSTALSGTLLPGTASTPIKRSLNDGADGSLRLIDSQGIINDLVGWGTSSQCYEAAPAITPPDGSGKSMQRYINCDTNVPVDTNNNSVDFALSDTPSPGILEGPLTTDCSPPPPPPDQGNTGNNDNGGDVPPENGGGSGGGSVSPATSCEGIIISELLPNPAGTDTDHEFIELFNPTTSVMSLKDCKLSTSTNTKLYSFGDIQMQPGQYKAFYNNETGLTLGNSTGGSVYLIDTDNTEIYQVDYAANLDDDVSWSLLDGDWNSSFAPTPNSANKLLATKPCPTGQIRNTDTNRCINIVEDAAGLSPCVAGKERNAETHRCRNIVSLSSVLKACAPDQTRNPSTNRCRKASSSASSLVPCKAGQQRNPQTNRCRKITGPSNTSSIPDVKDVLSATSANKFNWILAGGCLLGALLYAIWEWRQELSQKLLSLKNKFATDQTL